MSNLRELNMELHEIRIILVFVSISQEKETSFWFEMNPISKVINRKIVNNYFAFEYHPHQTSLSINVKFQSV